VKIVFFGNEQLAQGLKEPITPLFDGLIEHDFEIAALVLPRRAEIKSRDAKDLKIVESSNRHGVKVIYASEVNLSETLQGLGADVGVLISYGKVVPDEVINSFPHGIINVHPSLLPKYRGSSPIESAIVNLDDRTGISIMKLSTEMDAGPIYVQTEIALDGTETKPELYKKMAEMGADVLIDILPDIVDGSIKPYEQDEEQATYCEKLEKSDGELDPTIDTAAELDAKVRAYLDFPRTRLDGLIVTKTRLLDSYSGEDWPDIIPCANDTALQILEVVSPKSGKTMAFTDYLNGLNGSKI
jgi:methionyl-tRNA formyltransferase